jgi:heparanase 1
MDKQKSICRAIITFGLNALDGRHNVQRSFWAGKWNSTNAYDFVNYTISKGYPVDSCEFGNLLYFLFCTQHSFSYPFISKSEAILSSECINILVLSGNELSGHGTGARVDAELYGKDVTELRSILRQLYRAPLSQPLLLAPGGFFDQQWYTRLLQTSGHGVVSALTHHIYNLGGGM